MARREYFWESRDLASQKRFFRMTLGGLIVLFVMLWAGLNYMARAERKTIEKRRAEYERVVDIVREVRVLRASMGELSQTDAMSAVRTILAGYDEFPPSMLLRRENGVEVSFPGIPVSDLATFLSDIRSRANLQARFFEVEPSSSGRGLARARMILARGT
ncbi:type II secretion system protein GspM [Desulfovibrio oxyclinae]|jgi:type II secretory pathway component PulM|uniref:type II secretion system protein GspM n=1 Tax=Desulfovibrio oxyclinae TaxID=63560 RepID=UPI00036BCEDC|nr:type II secretion system protein GspM [Desulfovibrio oxyclinae]